MFLNIKKVGEDNEYQTGRKEIKNSKWNYGRQRKETVGTKMNFVHDSHRLWDKPKTEQDKRLIF